MRGRIANGQMYEAHQAVRTIAARYIRQKAYGEAIEILYNASKQLLEAKEAGSASDLTLYLISTYNLAETPVDGDSKARLVELVTKFDPSEPTLKSIAHEATQWSGKFGTNPFGDRELHHVFGSLFVRADEAYEAEKHLLLGTKESAPLLAGLLYEWYAEQEDEQSAALFLSRGVLGYLAIQNIRDAKTVLDVFLSELNQSGKLEANTVEQEGTTIYVYEKAPLLAFLQLLVITCQYKNADMFNRLKTRYRPQIEDVQAFQKPLVVIGQSIFGISPQRQGNILQDLMGSLFA